MSQWSNGVYLTRKEPWRGDQAKNRTFGWIKNDRHERGIRHLECEDDPTRHPWVTLTTLAGDTPANVTDVDDVKPPPGFEPTPEALSEEALVRWEQEQHNAATRRQARLNMLGSIGQDRKDSAQEKTWSKTKWLGRPAKGSSARTSTNARQHGSELTVSAGSSSESGSGCPPADKSKGPAAEEARPDAEVPGLSTNVPLRFYSNRVRVVKVTRPPPLRHHASIQEHAAALLNSLRERNKNLHENMDPPAGSWKRNPLDVELFEKFGALGHQPRHYTSNGDLVDSSK